MVAEAPEIEAATPDGIRHSLWVVSGDRCTALLSSAAAHPLLIADGHHQVRDGPCGRKRRLVIA